MRRAAGDLQEDIERVTGSAAGAAARTRRRRARRVVVGTLGKSAPDRSASFEQRQARRRARSAAAGSLPSSRSSSGRGPASTARWSSPAATSAARSSAIYDVSEQIGVSPWYWWADVPVRHRDALRVAPAATCAPSPAVKYRGIFLNDEAPALSGWAHEKFGGFNQQVLRPGLRAAPAAARQLPLAGDVGQRLRRRRSARTPARRRVRHRHGHLAPRADDARPRRVAALRQGPLELRHQRRTSCARSGPRASGARRAYEKIVTLGMRGDGDEPMSRGGQRRAAGAHRRRPAQDPRRGAEPRRHRRCPQVWALYKEVQEYYEKGMRVPDDVTLLWCDDNWGNIRRLPTAEEREPVRRRGHLLPLRLRRRPALLQVAQHDAAPEDLGADAPGLALRRRRASGSSTSATSSRWRSRSSSSSTTPGIPAALARGAPRRTTCGPGPSASSAPEHAGGDRRDRRDATRSYNGRRKPEMLEPRDLQPRELPRGGDASWPTIEQLAARAEALYAALPAGREGRVLPARALSR